MEHYLVKAQFGHVGRNNYIIKTIPVYAEDGKEAAYKVKYKMKKNKILDKEALNSMRNYEA